jgi:endonuclease/exonuclease/phosphatase family metal-dependent hydrolase
MRVERLSLLQMNLCLSGVAGCFGDTRYPRVVDEAIDVIGARGPDAVTFNEACSGDVARIAHETGYHVRFAAVLVRDRPLRCADPGGRGVFGNAVITRRTIHGSVGRPFAAQAGGEERRWICVETARRVDVCTAHLSTRDSGMARTANAGQCVEFAAVLALRDERGSVLAAGDFNRRDGCVPAGMSARSDARAEQLPGRQHGYGSTEAVAPLRVRTLSAAYTDHDYLLVRTSPLTDPRRARPAGRPTPGACPPWSPERGEPGSGRSARSSRTCV